MPTFHGLYYPYLHFQDEGWLKAAALYWDRMNRIVPPGARLKDSDGVKQFEEDGFVVSRDPHGAAREIARPFRELLRARGRALRKEFAIGPLAPRLGRRFLGTDDEISYISNEKFMHQLLGDLNDWGLIIQKPSDNGMWIGMHRELARVYMTALAETLAPDIGARPVADNAFDHIAIAGVTMERLVDVLLGDKRKQDPNKEIEGQMASIAFRHVIPREIAKIPALDIIKFRNDHVEERTQFHDEIGKIVKEMEHLRHIKTPEELTRHLDEAYQNRIRGKLERLENAMRQKNWDVVDSALGATFVVPTMLVAVLAGLGIVLSSAGGAVVGIAVGGWRLWRKRHNARADALKPSLEAYLYNAKRFFSAQELVEGIATDGGKFAPLL